MPVRDCGVGDPLCEVIGLIAVCNIRIDAFNKDVAQGRSGADLVGEGLAFFHELVVNFAACVFVVLGVDDGVVIRGGYCTFLCLGWRNVNVPNREWVLEHHEHGGVFLAGLRRIVGAEVVDVEVEFNLA